MNKLKILMLTLLIALTCLLVTPVKKSSALEQTEKDYTILLPTLITYNEDYRVVVESDVDYVYREYQNDYYIYGWSCRIRIYEQEENSLFYEESYTERNLGEITANDVAHGYNKFLIRVYQAYDTMELELYNVTQNGEWLTEVYTMTFELGSIEVYMDGVYNGLSTSYLWNDMNKSYLEGVKEGYNTGFEDGNNEGYNEGYHEGYQEGLETADNDFYALFTGIADTPFMILYSLLSFDIFGISLYQVLFSILTILVIIWVIRKFMI